MSQVGETVGEATWQALQAECTWRYGGRWTLTATPAGDQWRIITLLAQPEDRPKARLPEACPSFTGPDQAIDWGLGQGVFLDSEHARTAYAAVKDEHQPRTAAQMWAVWEKYVSERVANSGIPA